MSPHAAGTAGPPILSPTSKVRSRDLFCVFTGGAAVVALALAAKFCLTVGVPWQCPLMSTFHIPCPSCGSTRALGALSELHWMEAWRLNPLLVTAIGVAPVGYLFRARFQSFSRMGWPLFFGAVFFNWVYLFFFLPR